MTDTHCLPHALRADGRDVALDLLVVVTDADDAARRTGDFRAALADGLRAVPPARRAALLECLCRTDRALGAAVAAALTFDPPAAPGRACLACLRSVSDGDGPMCVNCRDNPTEYPIRPTSPPVGPWARAIITAAADARPRVGSTIASRIAAALMAVQPPNRTALFACMEVLLPPDVHQQVRGRLAGSGVALLPPAAAVVSPTARHREFATEYMNEFRPSALDGPPSNGFWGEYMNEFPPTGPADLSRLARFELPVVDAAVARYVETSAERARARVRIGDTIRIVEATRSFTKVDPLHPLGVEVTPTGQRAFVVRVEAVEHVLVGNLRHEKATGSFSAGRVSGLRAEPGCQDSPLVLPCAAADCGRPHLNGLPFCRDHSGMNQRPGRNDLAGVARRRSYLAYLVQTRLADPERSDADSHWPYAAVQADVGMLGLFHRTYSAYLDRAEREEEERRQARERAERAERVQVEAAERAELARLLAKYGPTRGDNSPAGGKNPRNLNL